MALVQNLEPLKRVNNMAGLFDEILRKEQQDTISPTPRNAVLGGLADLLAAASSPERTQQMQGLASFLSIPAVATTLDRLSYGEPLTTGSGGLGGTTRIRPEALEAAMAVAPMAPAAGQLAKRAVMATKGLPVGASIKGVGKIDELTGLPLNQDGTVTLFHHTNKTAAEKIAKSGQLKSAGEPNVYLTTQRATDTGYGDVAVPVRVKPSLLNLDDEFPSGRMDFSIDTGKPKGSVPVTVEKQSFQYPQEEAMRLAQQRAALPVEQGGLGLPIGNTAEQRAKAMGFDYNTTRFHGSDQDIYAFDPAKFGKNDQGWYGRGVTTDTDPEIASGYANYNEAESGQMVYPLLTRGKYMDWPEGQPPFSTARDSTQGTKDIQGLGYQGTRMTNDRDLYGGTPQIGTEQVTFNPDDVRSRFAAFDPFRRNAAIAAATGSLAPDLLAAQEDEVLKQRLSGLINSISP